jgi:hypothetical protein
MERGYIPASSLSSDYTEAPVIPSGDSDWSGSDGLRHLNNLIKIRVHRPRSIIVISEAVFQAQPMVLGLV